MPAFAASQPAFIPGNGVGGTASITFVDTLPNIAEVEEGIFVLNSDSSAWSPGMREIGTTPGQPGIPGIPAAVPGTLTTALFTTTQFARWFGVHASDADAGVSTSTDSNNRDFYFNTTIERLVAGSAGGWGISSAINLSGWPATYEWAGGFTNAAGAGSFDNLAALLAEFEAGSRVFNTSVPLVYHDRALGQVRYVTGYTPGLPAGRDVLVSPSSITTADLTGPLNNRIYLGAFTATPAEQNFAATYYHYGGEISGQGFRLNFPNPPPPFAWQNVPLTNPTSIALQLSGDESQFPRLFIGPHGVGNTDGVNTVAGVIDVIENPDNYGLASSQRFGTVFNAGLSNEYTITYVFFDSADNTVKVVTAYTAQVITPGVPAVPPTPAIPPHDVPALVRIASSTIRVTTLPNVADAHEGTLYVLPTGEGRIVYDAARAAVAGTGSHSPIPDRAAAAVATYVNYSHVHYLGVMASDPSPLAHSVGNYFYNSTTNRWRRLVQTGTATLSRHWVNWVGPPGGFLGPYGSDADATAHVTAIGNLFYLTTSNVIRQVQTFTPGNAPLTVSGLGIFRGIRTTRPVIPLTPREAEFYLNSTENRWYHYDGGTAVDYTEIEPAADGNLLGPSIVWMTEPPNINGSDTANYPDATAAIAWFEGRDYDPRLRYWYNDATDGVSQITHITQYPIPAGTMQAWQSLGAFRSGPATNVFNGTDRTAAETARDTYATANADWLSTYDNDPLLFIRLTFGTTTVYQVRQGSAWYDVPLVVKGDPGEDADASASQAARTGAEAAQAASEAARDQAIAARTGAETAETGAETAQTGAETAQAAAEAARTGAEAAVQTGAQAAQTGAEAARDQAVAARTGAETARTGAETAQAAAMVSAGQSAASAMAAQTAQVAAEAARDAAQSLTGVDTAVGTALAAAVTDNIETGITVTYENGKLNFVVPSGGGQPTHTSQYLAVKATQAFVAADFTGANGVPFPTGSHTVTAPVIAGNNYFALARLATDPDPTFLDLDMSGLNQIGGVTEQSATVTINGSAYDVWVSNRAIDVSGALVEFR